MNQEIMKAAGFNKEVEAVNLGNCPTCGQKIDMTKFKDRLSIKEFGISGMCQKCQDDIFG